MSYDVSIGKVSLNYTWNGNALFFDHIPAMRRSGGINELDGLTGRQAAAVISDALDRIVSTQRNLQRDGDIGAPLFCARYDPPNGWGSTVGALIFLSRILAACALHPSHRVSVT